MPTGLVSGEDLFLRWLPPAVSSCGASGTGMSSAPLIKMLIPCLRAQTYSCPNRLPKAHLFIPSPWGLGFQPAVFFLREGG